MKRIIAVMLLVTALFCLCACGEGSDTSAAESSKTEISQDISNIQSEAESKEESTVTASFKVLATDADGNAVSGVMIQLCKDTCIPAKTGEDGVATFPVEITDGYKLSVLSCPEGYSYGGDAEIYLESGITEYTVTLAKGE